MSDPSHPHTEEEFAKIQAASDRLIAEIANEEEKLLARDREHSTTVEITLEEGSSDVWPQYEAVWDEKQRGFIPGRRIA